MVREMCRKRPELAQTKGGGEKMDAFEKKTSGGRADGGIVVRGQNLQTMSNAVAVGRMEPMRQKVYQQTRQGDRVFVRMLQIRKGARGQRNEDGCGKFGEAYQDKGSCLDQEGESPGGL